MLRYLKNKISPEVLNDRYEVVNNGIYLIFKVKLVEN